MKSLPSSLISIMPLFSFPHLSLPVWVQAYFYFHAVCICVGFPLVDEDVGLSRAGVYRLHSLKEGNRRICQEFAKKKKK